MTTFAQNERTRRPRHGPTVDLVALPTRSDFEPGGRTEEIHAYLEQAEDARRRQLDTLPAADLDPVTAAYRATVERILDEVRTARRRVLEDLYGVCTVCDRTIPAERLQLRPWTTSCAPCASAVRH